MPLTTPRTTSAERAKALLQLPLRRVYPDTCTVKERECVRVYNRLFLVNERRLSPRCPSPRPN